MCPAISGTVSQVNHKRERGKERERVGERREPLWGTTALVLAAFLALVYFALNAIQVALRSLIQHDYNYS